MAYPSPMQPAQPYTGQIFQPTQTYTPSASQSMYSNSFDDEPPLLEGQWTTVWRLKLLIFAANIVLLFVFVIVIILFSF